MTTNLLPMRVLDADEAHHLGSLLASSGYFQDAKEAAQAAVKVMAGAELGLGPVASMRGVDIIKGEVSLGAGLVAALVRRSERYDYEIERWDDEGCTIVFTRDGKALNPTSSFTVADATRAGLNRPNRDGSPGAYQKYPRNMFFARAMTNGARLHCPDLFAGSVYTSAELTGDLDGEAIEASARTADEPGPESTPPPAPAPPRTLDERLAEGTLDEAIQQGRVEGVQEPAEATQVEGDRSIAQAAAQAPAPAQTPTAEEIAAEARSRGTAEPRTPSELARSLGIADATQRFILIGIAGVEDATDLDAAYQSLDDEQLEKVVAELNKRARS